METAYSIYIFPFHLIIYYYPPETREEQLVWQEKKKPEIWASEKINTGYQYGTNPQKLLSVKLPGI
jgi:hypothetical protein